MSSPAVPKIGTSPSEWSN